MAPSAVSRTTPLKAAIARYLPERLERALAASATSVIGLLAAHQVVQRVTAAIVARTVNHALEKEVVWGGDAPTGELGQTQWFTYLFMIFAPIALVAIAAVMEELLSRVRSLHPAVRALRWSIVVGAIVWARRTSPFAGEVALAWTALAGGLFAPVLGREPEPPPGDLGARAAGFVLCCAAIATGWTLWLVFGATEGSVTFFAIPLLLALVAYRIGASRAAGSHVELVRDAIAAAPCLLLPLAGLVREPSYRWLVGAALSFAALRITVAKKGVNSVPSSIVALAPGALVCAVFLPLRFRDLPEASLFKHEGQHLGWINAVLFGKWMMADAGLLYGPLRAYVLTLWGLFAGMTLEQIRIGQMLLNVVGLVVMLVVGFRMVGRRILPQAFLAYLLLTHSPLACMLDYRKYISFGWVDLARVGFAVLTLTGAIDSVERLPTDRRPTWREALPLSLWGFGTGLATLYSQEFGLCACGAAGLALGIDPLFRAKGRGALRRLALGVRNGSIYAIGFAALCLLFWGAYGVAGRGRLLVHAFATTLGPIAAGVYAAVAVPVSIDTPLEWSKLVAPGRFGERVWEWVVPSVVQIVAGAFLVLVAVRRRWTHASTRMLAVLLFTITAFRYSLVHSDFYHLIMGSAATWLLAAALLAEAWGRAEYSLGSRTLRAFIVAAIVFVCVRTTEQTRGVTVRMNLTLRGEELPSSGPPFAYAGVPRAGDMFIPPETLELVRFIQQNTDPHDAILFRMRHTMEGGEIHFLSARRNPTRFEMLSEIVTRADRADFFESVRRDPPKYVFGNDPTVVGPEADAFFRENWKSVGTIGGYPCFEYAPMQHP